MLQTHTHTCISCRLPTQDTPPHSATPSHTTDLAVRASRESETDMSSALPPLEEAESPRTTTAPTAVTTAVPTKVLDLGNTGESETDTIATSATVVKKAHVRKAAPQSSGRASLGLTLQNALIARNLRRKTLSAAVDDVGWSRNVGGGALAQKLRLRERVITFRILHLIFTFAVWQHFFYIKLRQRELAVPEKAPNYNWKLFVPPTEFGMMHSILFQLALIPITVSRSLLAWIATRFCILPLEHIMTLHIHIGYAFCALLIASSALFLVFFGKLCQGYQDGIEPANECNKFRTEIMATGLVILILTIAILLSSYIRGRLRFETFYTIHIVAVGVMYMGALVHTLDDEFRKGSKVGKARSQTFKWLIGSLAVFLADRVWRYLTQETEVPLVKTFCHADGGSVTLQILKPWWFSYTPGQYVHIQIPSIDSVWHPFSIGSDPESNVLTVIIEVVPKKGEWTRSVAEKVCDGSLTRVNIRGPFGNPVGPVANDPSSSNIVAVGSGTGIVPMISLFKTRAAALGQLSAAGLARTQSTLAERQAAANQAYCLGANISPATNERIRHCQLLYRQRRLAQWRKGAQTMPTFLKQRTTAAGSMMGLMTGLLVMFWVCIEASNTSLILSWSNLMAPAVKTDEMTGIISYLSLLLVVPYAMVVGIWVFCRSRAEKSPSLYVHVLCIIAMVGTVRYFMAYDKFENLSSVEQAALVIFSVWRVAAAWTFRRDGGRANMTGMASSNPVESFRLLWVTRSAELVIGVLEDLEMTMRDLERKMAGQHVGTVGTESFPQLEVKVWCTDSHPEHTAELKRWVKGTRFESLVVFERPDLGMELVTSMKQHIMAPSFMNRLPGETKKSIVTFCGSPAVSDALFRAVRRCGQLATVAGASDFQFTFRTESYSNMPKPRAIASAARAAEFAALGPVDGEQTPRRQSKAQIRRDSKAQQWRNMRRSLVYSSPPVPELAASPVVDMRWDVTDSNAVSTTPPIYDE
eukprot:m.35020 g.35020  ORF g.35020 m.35020 type:complete len:981 (+) comp5221_c0_seq1:1142-4084(+)